MSSKSLLLVSRRKKSSTGRSRVKHSILLSVGLTAWSTADTRPGSTCPQPPKPTLSQTTGPGAHHRTCDHHRSGPGKTALPSIRRAVGGLLWLFDARRRARPHQRSRMVPRWCHYSPRSISTRCCCGLHPDVSKADKTPSGVSNTQPFMVRYDCLNPRPPVGAVHPSPASSLPGSQVATLCASQESGRLPCRFRHWPAHRPRLLVGRIVHGTMGDHRPRRTGLLPHCGRRWSRRCSRRGTGLGLRRQPHSPDLVRGVDLALARGHQQAYRFVLSV